MNHPHNLLPRKEILPIHLETAMMSAIQCADVVIVDSAHYAVVLQYDEDGPDDGAPVVVALGVNSIACEIQQIACQYGIYCLENPTLAQSLYVEVGEIGSFIPEIFYKEVAEVLAYVYKMGFNKNREDEPLVCKNI